MKLKLPMKCQLILFTDEKWFRKEEKKNLKSAIGWLLQKVYFRIRFPEMLILALQKFVEEPCKFYIMPCHITGTSTIIYFQNFF